MLNGKIFFVRLDTAACMGIMHKIMVCNTLQHENNKGGCKRDLWLIRNASCGENDDYRDEVEEVVIYQGCNLSFFKIAFRYARKNLPKAVQNLYESIVGVKGNCLIGEEALQQQISFKVQQFSG